MNNHQPNVTKPQTTTKLASPLISRRKLIMRAAAFGISSCVPGRFLAGPGAVQARSLLVPADQSKPTAKVYAGSLNSNSIAVLNAETNQLLRSIVISARPHSLVATPDKTKIFVSSRQTSSLSVIDTASDSLVSELEVGEAPLGLAITPDGSLVAVAVNKANRVVFLDTITHQIKSQVAVDSPECVAFSLDGRMAFVTTHNYTELAIIEIANQTQQSVSLNGSSRILSYNRDGAEVYFALLDSDSTKVYQPITKANLTERTEHLHLTHALLNQYSTEFGLVVGKSSREMAILDYKHHSVKRPVLVGNRPSWSVLSLDGRTTYRATQNSTDISVLDSANSERMISTLRATDVHPLLFSHSTLPKLR